MVTVILVDMKQHLIVVWICISMMTSGLEDIFMCTLAISASSLRKRLFESFAHFKIVLFIFLLLHLSCSLHIRYKSLMGYMIWSKFHPFSEILSLYYGILKRIMFSILNDIHHYWQRICHPMQDTDTRDTGLIPGWARSLGGGNDNLLQYSGLENSMNRGAWQATVPGVAKSWTWLSMRVHVCVHKYTHTHTHTHQLI